VGARPVNAAAGRIRRTGFEPPESLTHKASNGNGLAHLCMPWLAMFSVLHHYACHD